jgi:plastocyanin
VRTVTVVAIAATVLASLGAVGDRGGPAAQTPAATAPPSGTGTLKGRVVLDGAAPEPKKLMVVKDVAVCGKVDHLDDRIVVGEGGGLRYAVVTVKSVKNGRTLASMGREFVLDQRACAYSPHVLLVPVGARLKILNSDGVMHNVHTFSSLNRPFNVAQPKTNKKIEKSFDVPERIPVRCDVHGWMSSWVVVVDDAYSAVTDEEGRFTIEGIPPGKYEAVCWQEELGEQTFAFEVVAGKVAEREVRYRNDKGPAAGK